jgi:UDP:flavonoid glycosyltransferase YjiC (YdhE family)
VRAALEALADEPVRVVAATGGDPGRSPGPAPPNATITPWVSLAQVMLRASLLVSQGGQGTLARALAEGVPAVVCPDAVDMAGNGARVVWSGAGVMLPRRLLAPRPLRLAVRRVLGDGRFAARAAEISRWSEDNDGAVRGADLVERYARGEA